MPTIKDYLNSDFSKRRSDVDFKFGKDKDIEIDKLSKELFGFINFQNEWIKIEVNEAMIDFAEILGKFLSPVKKDDKSALSNSQIRNVYGEIKRIQMSIDKNGWEAIKPSFLILKPKVAYAAGRNRNLGIVVFKEFFNMAASNVTNKKEYLNFCNLLESVLAYHRAFGGN
jgi:CRISPR-associated protein Csm2